MYVFYINGTNVEKRFGQEFINFICGGKIKHEIEHEECTRKKLVVRSSYAAKKLLSVNGKAFWPDGTRFRCKQINSRRFDHHHHHHHHHHRRQRRHSYENDCCTKKLASSSTYENNSNNGGSNSRPFSPTLSNKEWYASYDNINFDEGDKLYDKK
ncbi:late expression factor 6 [Spodoptera frugiperda multiple nucleopolyhedrovirus]|uniref:LEF-6 n=1 Tax=Spodoptera frugiperda nuclear polyhedrosis virus TaxID=10455 RepID=A1YJB8_NPVSF|nr:late expression factor 6 [Spodoptera frugiperda multiple nucleopolyhedrovirus]ABM45838.1 late expression factor 6 [Spodoptera frugiperda multiple nucleopolyhedrovirus]QED40041.1 LEF-6 [Spodoptera frugiperda multiple nucleopolyhedrovirus]